METQTYIEKAVNNMFDRKNERQIVIAYLFRKLLNQTQIEVGNYLEIDRADVRELNEELCKTLSNKDLLSKPFQNSFRICLVSCEGYATLNVAKRFKESLRVTKERFDNHYFLLN